MAYWPYRFVFIYLSVRYIVDSFLENLPFFEVAIWQFLNVSLNFQCFNQHFNTENSDY